MHLKIKLMLMLSVLPTNLFAASVYVEKPLTLNNKEDEIAAFYQLVIDAAAGEGIEVVNDKSKAETVLEPKMIPVGDSRIISITKNVNGSRISNQKEKITEIEDLDLVTARLVRAILNDSTSKKEMKIGEITKADAIKIENRQRAVGRWFFGFGPSVGIDTNKSGSMFGYTMGYAWEREDSLLKLNISGHSGINDNDSSIGGFGIGYTHLFSPTDTSQLAFAELLWGSASVKGSEKQPYYNGFTNETRDAYNNKSGFSLGVGYGLMMFRTSNINLETSLVYNQFLGNIDGHHPGSTGLRLTLYF